VLALGLVFGKDKMEDMTGVLEALPKVREFCRQFESEMGGITCREIAKSDFKKWYNREDPNESWQERNVSAIKHRTATAQKGVRIAADIILKSR
jgi:hypothetical protein